jgi:hypothetical protein
MKIGQNLISTLPKIHHFGAIMAKLGQDGLEQWFLKGHPHEKSG